MGSDTNPGTPRMEAKDGTSVDGSGFLVLVGDNVPANGA